MIRFMEKRKIKGATLVELVIVIVIVGIIFAIGSTLMRKSFDAFFTNQNLNIANWQGRLAFQRMVQEIREAKGANATDLNISSFSQITFNDLYGQTITYSMSGSNLQRNGKNVATGISALVFSYLDQNYLPTGTVTNVRCIAISATVTYSPVIFPLETTVCPRNFP
jgi:type II secretory pathway pseudopilin PulG